MKKVMRQKERGKVEVFFACLLAFALVFSLMIVPGTSAFAEDENAAQEQEVALFEEGDELSVDEPTEPEPNEVSDEDVAVDTEEVAIAEETALSDVVEEADGGEDIAALGVSGVKVGQVTYPTTGHGYFFDLYDDGVSKTAIAVGFDPSTKQTGFGWTFRIADGGKITVTGANAGEYTVVEIADDFNFDPVSGERIRCNRVTIPETVEKIGSNAFLDAGVTALLFSTTTTGTPSALKTIGDKAFYNCRLTGSVSGFSELVFPEGIETIGDEAFACDGDRYSMANYRLTLPSTLKEIGDGAFRNCHVQFNFNFGTALTRIGDYAFQNGMICPTNNTLTFPGSLTYIGRGAFKNLKNVEGTVVIPDSVTHIGSEAFFGLTNAGGFSRQKLAGVQVNFPQAPGNEVYLASGFDGVTTSNDGSVALGKSAEWTNGDLTEALINIDYGEQLAVKNKLDIVFVLDYSGSMTWSAEVESGGQTYTYPRIFLMEDIMSDAIDELLGAGAAGYDIRLAMTGFSSDISGTNWTTGNFTTTSAQLKGMFAQNPHAFGGTQYKSGIDSAIDIIDGRTDAEKSDRQAVVIFLSDGLPNAGHEGLAAAQDLRDKNVSLFPMGVYINDLNEGTPAEAEAALKAISIDKNTAYVANTTGEFESIMQEVIIRSVTTLNVAIEDIMSEFFEVIDGDVLSIEASAGAFEIDGDKVIWNLTGEDKGVLHNLKIKVALKDEYHTQADLEKILDTNDSLRTIDENGGSILQATEQPNLYRGAVNHVFESGTEGMDLPAEINNHLPTSPKGYHKDQKVNPLDPKSTTYADEVNGGVWTFQAWDKDEVTIGSGDATFVGTWVFAKYPVVTDPVTPSPAEPTPVINTVVPKTGDLPYLTAVVAIGVVALGAVIIAAVVVSRRKSIDS